MNPTLQSPSQGELTQRLHQLYADQSKHSVYQNIPEFVRHALGYSEKIDEHWRGDSSRWDYMQKHIDLSGGSVLDVGANTGFFTLSLAHAHPSAMCTALEGNSRHAEFIGLVANQFGLGNVRVLSQYLGLHDIDRLGSYDVALLFNVLHHAGVDFDQALVPTRNDLADYLVQYLGALRHHAGRLVFQMGFNWGGNKQEPVVPLQDDAGKVVYAASVLRRAGWRLDAIALSRERSGTVPVTHENVPEDILAGANRGDDTILRHSLDEIFDPKTPSFSEFYRRPLFVCSSGN
jgi:SAM-dependent methyltransferase